ncbi:hypothetical protein L1887_33042 [Cichorium endivia]|nr:hypothetical protein L1887_33042 [Cichorium endivia]
MEFNKQCTRFRTCNELLQSVRRLDEQPNELSVTEMTELEEELNDALMHTRARKTQLMMERISTFQEQERKLTKEKEELKQQVASAKQEHDVDDGGGGGGLHDSATNLHHTNPHPPQQLPTLALFKD